MLKINSAVIIIILSIFKFYSNYIYSQIKFEDYFEDKTLRIDYYHSGNHSSEYFILDQLIEEKYWAGNKKNLLIPFNYGKYQILVKDASTGVLIYSYNYSTLFSEWQTTAEAKSIFKVFHETVIIPFPKLPILVEFYSRDSLNNFNLKFKLPIDPKNPYIVKEQNLKFNTLTILDNGQTENKVDIVFIPEGYRMQDSVKLLNDANRFMQYLFNSSPFKENKDKFNIRLIFSWSEDTGTDVPPKNIWKNTLLNSRFYTFYLDRYLMTSENKILRNVAGNVPYDQIYILVNSDEYGGGGIYNHYALCTTDNKYSEYVFIHEFGHSFAFLADEYYSSEVAYTEFYKKNLEPLEPNITTLVDFDSKWKNFIKSGTPLPTPNSIKYKDIVGLFEGAGYSDKGIFRPELDCTMKSISVDNFCDVCKNSIIKMFNYYCD